MSAITSEVTDNILVITRVFDAPRELVYRAYTEADQIAKWWGPKGFMTTVPTMDVRPGGVWHYCMSSPEWGDSWGLGMYREVVPPERLVYVDAFSDAEGNINEELPQASIEIDFTETNGRTLMTIRTEYPTGADLKKVLDMQMLEGMSQTLDNLDELLKELQAV